jgi:hypothetical protein
LKSLLAISKSCEINCRTRGRNFTAVYQDLVDQFGFSASYNSVKRFAATLISHRLAQPDEPALQAEGPGRWKRGLSWGAVASSRKLLDFFSGLRVRRLAVHSAIFLPSGNRMARTMERVLPHTLPWGGLVVISGETG